MSAIYQKPRQFDIISDAEYVCVQFSLESSEKISLVYIDEDEKSKKELTLDPIEYLKALAEYRARYGWQTLFVAGERSASKTTELKKELEILFHTIEGR